MNTYADHVCWYCLNDGDGFCEACDERATLLTEIERLRAEVASQQQQLARMVSYAAKGLG